MLVSFKHAVLLAGLWLAFPSLGATPCDEIHILVATHELHVGEGNYTVRLNRDGDLVVILGERVAEAWLLREDRTEEVPTPFQSPRAGSAVLTFNGQRLLLLSKDRDIWKLRDWDMVERKENRSYDWHPSDGVPYLIDEHLALVSMPGGGSRSGDQRLMNFWNPRGPSRLRPLQHISPGRVEEVLLSPGALSDGVVAIRFDSPEMRGRLVSVATGNTIVDIPEGWKAFAFSPSGRMFAQSRNRTIYWRNTLEGKIEGKIHLRGPGVDPHDVIFVDELRLLVNEGGRLKQWEIDPLLMQGDSNPTTSMSLETNGTQIVRTALSPNKKLVVTSFSSGEVIVWDRKTWMPIAELAGHDEGVHTIQFSEDSSTVLTADAKGGARIWDLDPTLKAQQGTSWGTMHGVLTITRDSAADQTRIRIDRNLSL